MKIQLNNEMETLLIPLYGKARMSKTGVFKDLYAESAIEKIDYDYTRLKIQDKTQVMLAVRAAILDDLARDFIVNNPNCTVLHLGCGLDARYMRLGFRTETWYDLDFPEVIEIKSRLFGETDNYKYIASSVTDLEWINCVSKNENSTIVIAEGLFMYLSKSEIKAILRALKSKFESFTLIFDAYSTLTAKRVKQHPSLKKTGAVIKWGVDDPKEIEGYAEGIKYIDTIYFTDKTAIEMLPQKYRTMFRLAGFFKSAREAHRIFIFSRK